MINVATFFMSSQIFFSSINGKFFSINGISFSFLAQNSKRNGSVLEMAIFEEMQWQMNENWIFVLLKKALSRDQEKTHPDLIRSTSYKGGAFKYVKVKLNQWSREIYSTDADSNGFFDRLPPAPSLASDKYRVKKEPEM